MREEKEDLARVESPTSSEPGELPRQATGEVPLTAPEQTITLHVCGGAQARRCIDGGEHDMSGMKLFKDGGSVACAKCGVTAMQLDLMELP